MKSVKIKHVDAFTKTPFEGNPACVVNIANGLDEKQMQFIAKEMNLSETAFVLPPTNADADLRLRWFTPTIEVPLCGHATVAAFHSLAEDGLHGMEQRGNYKFRLETKSGILPIEVIKTEDNIEVKIGLVVPEKFDRFSQYKLDIVRILNMNLSDLEPKMLILRTNYLFIPVRRLHVLYGLHPNYFALTNFMNQKNLQGVCVFTQETIDRDSSIHMRFFAPNEGILEDPVTGSAHGALAVYMYENGLIQAKDGIGTYQAEQGDCLGRKGRVNVSLKIGENKVESVYISGSAITIFSTEMLISDKA
jgi:trans-2,3-dihydro-3-hydroxyanthranilate isomerase